MWDINEIISRIRINVNPPPPPPPPPPKPKPQIETASVKKADLRQTENFFRNKIENLFNFEAPAVCTPTKPVNPSASQILQIAQQNAPLLVLPKSNSTIEQIGEQVVERAFPPLLPNVSQGNLLADPQTYIEKSRLREDVPFGLDRQLGDNTNGDLNDNFTSSTVGSITNERNFLDLNNDMRGKLGSQDAPVFYQFQPAKDGAPPKLTYHLFYDYNDAPKSGPIDLNHEGDWERVTYELDPTTFQPVKATLSAHEGGSTSDFQSLERDTATGRPLVYVANGSHANYATPGNHTIEFKGFPVTFDQTSAKDDAVIFDTARNLNEVTSQSWYPATGRGLHWGEIGESDHSSGPQGPSEKKGAV